MQSKDHKRDTSVDHKGRHRITAHCRSERMAFLVTHSASVKGKGIYVYIGGGVEYQSDHVTSVVIRCADAQLFERTVQAFAILGLTRASAKAEMDLSADLAGLFKHLQRTADSSAATSVESAQCDDALSADSLSDWSD